MEPLYLDGQIIWIHKQETLEEGEIGVFFLDGDAYVKKYHQSDSGIQLISLNKKYAPIQVTSGSTLKTFGKVVRAKRGAGKITADALFGTGRKINALGFPAAAVIVIVRGKDQMASNFPGNRGRALAKFVSNLFEAPSFFDASLDRDSVRECKVFAFVGFNKSIHK